MLRNAVASRHCFIISLGGRREAFSHGLVKLSRDLFISFTGQYLLFEKGVNTSSSSVIPALQLSRRVSFALQTAAASLLELRRRCQRCSDAAAPLSPCENSAWNPKGPRTLCVSVVRTQRGRDTSFDICASENQSGAGGEWRKVSQKTKHWDFNAFRGSFSQRKLFTFL